MLYKIQSVKFCASYFTPQKLYPNKTMFASIRYGMTGFPADAITRRNILRVIYPNLNYCVKKVPISNS